MSNGSKFRKPTKDEKARFFDLQTKISYFFQEGKRCPEQILDLFQIINENENFNNLIENENDRIIIPQLLVQKLGIIYPEEKLKHFGKVMPSYLTIQENAKNGFILTPGPPKPMSLLDLVAMDPKSFYQPRHNGWYKSEEFSLQDMVYPKLMFLNKGINYSRFISKKYETQKSLLKEDEYVPNVASMVWFIITCTYSRIKVKNNVWFRTSSFTTKHDLCISVMYDDCGIHIGVDSTKNVISDYSLAVGKKY